MSDTLGGLPSFSPIISVPGTFGAVFVGAFISLSLYGLFVHQAFKYFSLYGSDALWLKGLVIVAFIFETGVSVLHIHLTYFYFVENYGNTLAFFEDVWSINIMSIISTCIMITCQSFYATRILLIGPRKYKYLPVVVSALLMAGALGISIAITIVGFRGLAVDNFQMLLNLTLAYNTVASGTDVILTVTIIYILHRCRTGLKRTDGLINRLIMYTISTDALLALRLLTTIFNILSAVLIRVLGMNNWAWLGTMMIAERLYSNALMAALNSRKFTVKKEHANNDGRRTDAYGTAIRISTVRFDHGPASSTIDGVVELPQTNMKPSELEGGSGSTLAFEKDGREMYDG